MNKTIKNAVIFIVVFFAAAVGITHFSIRKAVEDMGDLSAESGIDLYGTYDENDLLIKEKTEIVNGLEIKIPQINGLKDKNVQEKVNKEIYDRCHELIGIYEPINYAVYHKRANFGNVLSISFNVGNNTGYDQVYLNYELVHGNMLELEDLFLQDTDIREIVRKAFYQSMIKDGAYTEEDRLAFPDENELYKAVKGYMGGDTYKFSFSPAEITFYYKDHVASIRMIDIADKVSVYSRYMTDESIFENDGIGYDDVFTCADTQYGGFEWIDYGYREPNFWYDVTAGQEWTEDIDEEKLRVYGAFKSEMMEAAYDKVEEYAEIAKSNPDQFYILLARPNVGLYIDQEYNDGEWDYTVSNVATVGEYYELYEMPMELYENTYKDRIIDTYRYIYFGMRGGAYFDTYYDNVGEDITVIQETKLCNYYTGEELTELEDVFHKDSGYMDVIERKTREFLGYRYDSQEYIAQLVDMAEYSIEGSHIRASIPSIPDFYVNIFFDEFDREMLKIFD